HALESWGDARAFDGTASLTQPLIEPLYGGKTLHEMMAVLLGHGEAAGYDLGGATWQGRLPGGGFGGARGKALHDGVIPGAGAATKGSGSAPAAGAQGAVAAAAAAAAEITTAVQAARAAAGQHPLTLCFQPDPTIHDGSWAPNVWLQELPK